MEALEFRAGSPITFNSDGDIQIYAILRGVIRFVQFETLHHPSVWVKTSIFLVEVKGHINNCVTNITFIFSLISYINGECEE